ncbi:MAG TPA: quinone oxidoreductase [Micromonosporaceae bacterium]|jgi:NADPH2:quinone reductase
MQAIVVQQYGGPEEISVQELSTPTAGPGEVVIDVAAAGVNYLDIYERQGRFQHPLPFTPGVEGCGRIVEVGLGVSGLREGQRVGWVMFTGSYAQRIVIPAFRVFPIPDEIDDSTAGAGLVHAMTAVYLTSAVYPVDPQTTMLVQGAEYGARPLLVQLARHLGARVIASVRQTAEKAAVQRAGAHEVLAWQDGDVTDQVRELTDGTGVDVVYDANGQATFKASLASLRVGGTYVQMAEVLGAVRPFDPGVLTERSTMFCRPLLAHHIRTRDELVEISSRALDLIARGTLRIKLGEAFSLGDAAKAQWHLESHTAGAKPLIFPNGLPS